MTLGDLSRYIASATEKERKDYSRAKKFYLRASRVAPWADQALHQAAVVCLLQDEPLAAVYYFSRRVQRHPKP